MPVVLIAGSAGRERDRPAPGPDPDWSQPLHIRDPAAARRALAARVAAGADALLAPTWLTHRRALLRVGESRRAAEWTQAAVRVAREAADAGLTVRSTDVPGADGSGIGVTVAGVLPRLDAWADETTGRRPSTGTARAADLHELAGILTDAGSDVLLVEDQGDAASWAEGVRAALASGLPVWAAVDQARAQDGPTLETIGSCSAIGAYALLVDAVEGVGADAGVDTQASTLARTMADLGRLTGLEVGVLMPAGTPDADLPTMVRSALEADAWAVGLATDATTERIAVVRKAIDDVAAEREAAREAADAAWRAYVADAAQRARGGRALWLSDEPPRQPPESFAWTFAAWRDLPRLPAGAFRLVVSDGGHAGVRALTDLLDEGGILVARGDRADTMRAGAMSELRILRVAESDGSAVITARRR